MDDNNSYRLIVCYQYHLYCRWEQLISCYMYCCCCCWIDHELLLMLMLLVHASYLSYYLMVLIAADKNQGQTTEWPKKG